MASSTEFSRTLSLLRQERGVSQRTAAADLGISQALLSHYENGIREPGLAFVVRACDYYHVSADFILGRTLSREGNMLTEQEILNAAEPGNILQGQRAGDAPEQAALRRRGRAVRPAGQAERQGRHQRRRRVSGQCCLPALPPSVPGRRRQRVLLFPGRRRLHHGAAEADRKLSELRYAGALRELASKKAEFPDLSNQAINAAYPGRARA